MSFDLLACTDIRGEKLNVELPFMEPPDSLAEFYCILERVFRGEENDVKKRKAETSIHPSEPFTVSRVQRYEEDTQTWLELNDVCELHLHDQLYVFRRHATRADISTQRDIPAPRKSSYFISCELGLANTAAEPKPNHNRTWETSPSPPLLSSVPLQSGASGVPRNENLKQNGGTLQTLPAHHTEYSVGVESNGAHMPTMEHGYSNLSAVREHLSSEQVGVVFAVGDSNHRGYLTLRDFQGMLNACEIQFPMEVLEEIHCCFAAEKRGEAVMGFQDFQNFVQEFAQTASVAYTRLGVRARQRDIEQEQRDNAAAVDGLQAEKKALEGRLEVVRRQLTRENEKEARLRNELDDLRGLDEADYREQEQRLLDKEVVVFQYRQKLHQEENDYERLVAERRRRKPNMSLGKLPVQIGGCSYKPRQYAVAAAAGKYDTKRKW
ncbi:calmodulin-like protein containing EF hand [Trypanosoma rangeli]|uniref:Calmodulin-like protein containing EF hand n=1 Tax=Trypanosoma rangeli TaxID=5698 RepID=A0A3R7KQJ5_TRYRA|nr:calmodulin-like protein containing EF hand [Trypanosoma rangeli]RNE99404.1 calmodulin-like protein containing EF hand [Trypanosoma rangeli]|eukprot:RNE99404.1 calmodulin-like protein containing EF hand [Trypanosoma rangeli]